MLYNNHIIKYYGFMSFKTIMLDKYISDGWHRMWRSERKR